MQKKLFYLLLLMAFFQNLGAQIPGGFSLLPSDSVLFKTGGTGNNISLIQAANISGQPFKNAYRITTGAETGNKEYRLSYPIKEAIQKDDIFLLSFYSRTISSKRETGLAFFEIRLDRFVNRKYIWPPLLERGQSFGTDWVFTQIPFKAAMDITAGDLAMIVNCGNMPQTFDIAGLTLVNYKQQVNFKDLPRSVVHYDGDAADASWRKEAEERIEKFRKTDLSVKVVDKNGNALPGATVTVHMKKSAFAWGTATSSQIILDKLDTNSTKYRDTLLRYFNKVVLENEMKAKNWHRFKFKQTQAGLNWLRDHGIPVRGHVMVWPSWKHSPQLIKYKNDTAALRGAILNQITQQTNAMKGQFIEWDVINETFAHHDIIDMLGGKTEMLRWFETARKNAPAVKLFLNEYTMFHPKNAGSEYFFNTIKYLVDNGAAIDAIGEQAHIGGTPPSINYVLERLNRFSVFNLPIQISEFDITSDDDDFKASYMRDFMTAIFSHPSTMGFMQWGFWESAHWMPAGALWDKNWNLRPNGKVYTDLVTKTWATNVKGFTDSSGYYSLRAFRGDYEITVSYKDRSKTQNLSLNKKATATMVEL